MRTYRKLFHLLLDRNIKKRLTGAGVTFDSDEFTDWTEHIKDTDPILEKFK